MQVIISIYIFVVGLAFGSFALAMADRMKSGKDWVRGRSKCDHCKHVLAVKDLIPIISWVMQGGKCRYCKKKLSVMYPLAEFGTGLAFLLSYLYLPYELTGLFIILFVFWLFATVIMSALVTYDIRWFKLPNKLIYPLIITAGIHRVVAYFAYDEPLTNAIILTTLSVVISAGVFWILYQISKGKWIGDGDIRLGLAIGLFLPEPALAWLAMFTASITGLLISIPALLKAKDKMKLKIPFGPFLIIGLYITYLAGESLIDWYSTTFLYF